METLEISQEMLDEVKQVLDALTDPAELGNSRWVSSCLVSNRLKTEPTITTFQALKEVFGDVLLIIQAESPDYADLLRGRFWEGHNVNKMVIDERPKAGSKRTFFNYQTKAIYRFTQLLWEKEQACLHATKPVIAITKETTKDEADTTNRVDVALILPSKAEDENDLRRWPRLRNITVFSLLVISIIAFVVWKSNSTIVSPQLTPIPTDHISTAITATAVIATTTVPSLVNHLLSGGQICGEAERITAPNELRFVRHQGVSAFTVENTQGAVMNNRVRALTIDQRGLWIGYWATDQNPINGIGQYDKTTWANCNTLNRVTQHNINAIATDQNGNVWIGTEKAGVARFDGQGWRVYTVEDGLPSNEIFSLTIDDTNNVWVGTWEDVAKFDGKVWSVPYTVHNHTLFNNHVHSIAIDSTGNIWVGHIGEGGGVSQFRKEEGTWVHHTTMTSGIGGDNMRDIEIRMEAPGSAESVWFATSDGGVSRFEQGNWHVYTTKDGLPSNEVLALEIDSFGRIWAGTAGGVAYFDDVKWTMYNTFATLSIAIGPDCSNCPFDKDHIWTGTDGLGLTHSRIPYPNDALDVTEICFESAGRERSCQTLTEIEQTKSITITYPNTLRPGDKFRTEITVTPLSPYELRADRGDFLSNKDKNDDKLFGAWENMPVTGITTAGQRFTFTSYDYLFTAPELTEREQERTFVSTWQVWMHTRYVGPQIYIAFTVRKP